MIKTAFKQSIESGLISAGIEGQSAAESESPSSVPTRTTSVSFLPLIFTPMDPWCIFTASPSCRLSMARSSLRIPQGTTTHIPKRIVEEHSLIRQIMQEWQSLFRDPRFPFCQKRIRKIAARFRANCAKSADGIILRRHRLFVLNQVLVISERQWLMTRSSGG
jgi:hypothetical protein